jgi:DNA-binding IscR family transcriptional regulator
MVNQKFATAVHILTNLAYSQLIKSKSSENPVNKLNNSDRIAASVNTNPVVIRRLIKYLTTAGLVKTSRGKTGGIELSKDPHDITLKDIYVALPESKSVSPRQRTPYKKCPVSCSMFNIMSEISIETERAKINFLATKKLSDLIEKIEKA